VKRIFKLQMPVFFNGGDVLGYNESREFQGLFPVTREMQKLFGRKAKIYVYGNVDEKGLLHIAGIAPDQDW